VFRVRVRHESPRRHEAVGERRRNDAVKDSAIKKKRGTSPGGYNVTNLAGPALEELTLIAGRPKSFTNMAPDTLKRSVITMFISAFNSIPRWNSVPSFRPTGARNQEHRQQQQCDERYLPTQDQHGAITIVTRITLPTTFEKRS